eukprot:jgi/Mesvir1/2646/Mv11256-RA.1
MDSVEAWQLVVDKLPVDDVINVAEALKGNDALYTMAVKEHEFRVNKIRDHLSGDFERLKEIIRESSNAEDCLVALKTKLDLFYESECIPLGCSKFKERDVAYAFIVTKASVSEDVESRFSEDHLHAAMTILGVLNEDSDADNTKEMSALVRAAHMAGVRDHSGRVEVLAWIMMDALGIEMGSFFLLCISVFLNMYDEADVAQRVRFLYRCSPGVAALAQKMKTAKKNPGMKTTLTSLTRKTRTFWTMLQCLNAKGRIRER